MRFTCFGNNDEYDYFRNLNNPGGMASPTTEKTDNYALSLAWNATWTPKFFTEVVVSRRNTNERPDTPNNALAADNWGYYYRYGSGAYAGYQIIPTDGVAPNSYGSIPMDLRSTWLRSTPPMGGGIREHTFDRNDQIRLKGTNLFDALGRHELSYGFQYYDIKYDYNFNYTGPGWTEANAGDPFAGHTTDGGAVIRWHRSTSSRPQARYLQSLHLYRAQGFMNNNNKKTTQNYYAYWAQDNWNLTDYFMLKLGLRLDQIHMKGGDNNINVPLHLRRSELGQRPRPLLEHQRRVGPRIGFTWDVAHNNKSKLYGFWGQYYERIPQRHGHPRPHR